MLLHIKDNGIISNRCSSKWIHNPDWIQFQWKWEVIAKINQPTKFKFYSIYFVDAFWNALIRISRFFFHLKRMKSVSFSYISLFQIWDVCSLPRRVGIFDWFEVNLSIGLNVNCCAIFLNFWKLNLISANLAQAVWILCKCRCTFNILFPMPWIIW